MGNVVVAVGRDPRISSVPGDQSPETLDRISALVERAVGLCLNGGDFFRSMRVLVKPVLAAPEALTRPGPVTDPRVVSALCRLLLDAGAREVWVGGFADPEPSLAEDLVRIGVRLRRFDREEAEPLENPEGVILRRTALPRAVLEADRYVNLATLATHLLTKASLGLMGQLGLLSEAVPARCDLAVAAVDLLRAVRPALTLVEGVSAVEGQAPFAGGPAEGVNAMVCGQDAVAVDAVCAALMGFHPAEMDAVRLAAAEGRGCADLSRIEVRGESLADSVRPFRRAVTGSMGVHEGLHCVEGGACAGCLAALRSSVDRLMAEGRLKLDRPVTAYAGRPLPGGDSLRRIRGDLLLFGDCALSLPKAEQGRGPVTNLPGCPPRPMDFHKAYLKLRP